MSKRIYFAAPLHKEADALHNVALGKSLRKLGFDVVLPQEFGIASDLARQHGTTVEYERRLIQKKDYGAMMCCDICLAYINREEGWSDGQLWEMGWFAGMNKPVVIYNPLKLPLTLMAEFSCLEHITEPDLDKLVEILGCL